MERARVRLALIAAVAENGVIGRDNALPWRLPGDLAHFRRVTMGKPIVMGRRTFESIGRALPGRSNIVITRNPAFEAQGCRVVHALEPALELAVDIALEDAVEELVVIGGAAIYAGALPRADRIYLTQVRAPVPGDTFFPDTDWTRWRETEREDHDGGESNAYPYSFVVYERH